MDDLKRVSLTLVLFTATAVLAASALRTAAAQAADAAQAPIDRAAIEKAVAAIADYELGKSRAPLAEVERLVLATRGQPELRQHLERQFGRLLESQATDECRLFVCRQLGMMGTDDSVPALRKMLADEKAVHMACYGLASNPSPAAAKALRDAAETANGNALLCIVGVLGDRRDPGSVPILARLVASNDAAAVDAAAAALGKVSGPKAAAALAKARTAGDANTPAAVTHGYLQCARGLAAAGNKDLAGKVYRELMAEGEPEIVRRGALAGLMDMGTPDAVPLAVSMLGGEDGMLKATAIANIRTLKGEGATDRFAKELPKLAPPVQVLLVGALADRGDDAARPAVEALAGAENAEVRTAAVRALASLGDASSVPLLAKAAAHGKSDAEKRAALVSLRGIDGKGIDEALVKSMKAAAPDARKDLIEVLLGRDAKAAVPALLAEAAGPDAGVSSAALRALARLAEAKDLSALLTLLANLKAEGARADAEGAAVAVARSAAEEAGRADAVLAALAAAPSPAAKCSLLRVLRGIGNAKAFEAVQAALKDSDARVQDAAVRSLADWPDTRATRAVLDICRATPNETHRIVAMRGCVRLLNLQGIEARQETLKAYQDLMGLARRPEEKRLLLSGLANVNDAGALALVEPCLEDPSVQAEAALAAVKIARGIVGADRDEAVAAMKRLAAATKDENLRRQAEEIVRLAGKLGDFLTAWQVCGPYLEEGKDYKALFDVAFAPETADAKDVTWRLLPIGAPAGPAAVLDLAAPLGGGENRVAYLRTSIHADKAQDARLELGIDDGAKVFLNGKVVYGANVGGACIPGSHKADVTLRQGWNLLVLKITQCQGPWQFCARLCKRDGSKLEGIRAAAMPR